MTNTNTLLNETLLYGNLELIYNRKKIRNIDLEEFISIIENNTDTELGHMWTWRFYKNYKFLYSVFENNIIEDRNKGILFINLTEKIINLALKFKVELKFRGDGMPILILVKELEERLKNIRIFNESSNIQHLIKLFDDKFGFLLNNYKNNNILLDYLLPYERNNWSPSWCLNFDDEQEIIPSVDIFIDYYFLFPEIRFNNYMSKDIPCIIKRLKFLEEKAKNYYEKAIEGKIFSLTKNIFHSYPYKLIFDDYLILAKNYSQTYLPELLKYFDLDKIKKDIWLLAILPKYLSAYLLGFSIISCDVPNEKNLSKVIEKVIEKGVENYWEEIYQRNNSLIELKSMDIDCGNNKEEEKILDLTYTPVIEYNPDDTFLLFNEGVFYIFTYPEFDDLINKERNPYNRNQIPLLSSMLSAIKFKKKIKRQLNSRFLDVELKSTMEDNFNLIKDELEKENNFISNSNNYHNFTNSLINLFLQNNFFSN